MGRTYRDSDYDSFKPRKRKPKDKKRGSKKPAREYLDDDMNDKDFMFKRTLNRPRGEKLK